MIILIAKGGTVTVGTDNLLSSVFLLLATVVAIIFILIVRKWTIGKRAGLLLIGIYILYVIYVSLSVLR